MSIVIIDDGINDEELKIKYNTNITHYILNQGSFVSNIKKNNIKKTSHGTICAHIVLEYASKCSIIDLCILKMDESYLLSKNIIIALKWCLTNYKDISIINMSIGTLSTKNSFTLQNLIQKLFNKNILIVCSCSNTNRITFPASLNYSIGVRCDQNISSNTPKIYYIKKAIDGISFLVALPLDNIYNFYINKYQYNFSLSNSLVTPYIVALIYNISKTYQLDFKKSLNFLKKSSLKYEYTIDYYKKNIYKYKNIYNITEPILKLDLDLSINKNRIFIDKLIEKFRGDNYICCTINIISRIETLDFKSKNKHNLNLNYIEKIANLSFFDLMFLYDQSNNFDSIYDLILSDKKSIVNKNTLKLNSNYFKNEKYLSNIYNYLINFFM